MSQVHSHFLGNTEHHSFIRLRGESEVLSGIIDGRRSYRLVCVYVSVKSCVCPERVKVPQWGVWMPATTPYQQPAWCGCVYTCVFQSVWTGHHGPGLCHCSGLASLVYQLQTHWTLTHTHPSGDTHAQCSWALCMAMPSAFKKRKTMLVWLYTRTHTWSIQT